MGSKLDVGEIEALGNIRANVSNAGGFYLTADTGVVRNSATGVGVRTAGNDRLVVTTAGTVSFAPIGNNKSIVIDTPTSTVNPIVEINDCNSLTDGNIMYLRSDSSNTNTRSLVKIHNDNAAATGTTGLEVRNDSTGPAIYANGDVGVGTSSSAVATQSTDMGVFLDATNGRIYATATGHHDLNRTTAGEAIRFRMTHVACGDISVSSGATAYNTSSDYRLKENVTELTGALDRLDSIPVYNFNFKSDPTRTVDGFLAHEVSEFVPEAITGTKDEMESVVVTKAVEAVETVAATYYEDGDELPDGKSIGDEKTPAVEAVEAVAEVTEEQPKYQGIDQSKLVPLMLAAIKELKAKVETLENA